MKVLATLSSAHLKGACELRAATLRKYRFSQSLAVMPSLSRYQSILLQTKSWMGCGVESRVVWIRPLYRMHHGDLHLLRERQTRWDLTFGGPVDCRAQLHSVEGFGHDS